MAEPHLGIAPFVTTRKVAVLICALLLAAAARAAAPELPPLNDPPTSARLPGKFVWVDLLTPDPESAQAFYGKLFGWTFRKISDGENAYTLAYLGDEPMAGILRVAQKAGEKKPARWIGFISVADVAAAQRAALREGGKVLVGARSFPKRGELAVLADREGAIFGVMTSSSGDAEDFLAEIGDWIWAQFLSRQGERAAGFYAAVGNSTVLDAPRPDGGKRWLLVSQGYARASVVELPRERTDAQAGWLGYIRVAGVESTLTLARKLGAKVLVAPRTDLFAGKVAVLADPSGGIFGVLEWDPMEREGAK